MAGLFSARAAATPDAVALVSGPARWSYRELDAAAGRVAGYLAGLGTGPESVVAVVLERGADLVITLLGVLKAGAAYLPADPGYPPASGSRSCSLMPSRRSWCARRKQLMCCPPDGRCAG